MTDVMESKTNVPDWGAEESARLRQDYDGLDANVANLLDEARKAPERVENEDDANVVTKLIGRFADLDKTVEAFRQSEKAPHLRKGDAVDSFFFALRDRLFRRTKNAKAGGADVLHARLHDYNERRRAEEQRKRDEEARRAREEEERIARERRERERLQREEEERAARARKAENKAAADEAARKFAEDAQRLRDEEEAARSKRAEADAAAAAKPSDMVRERHGDGALNTMRREGFAEITDAMMLNATVLWPFVPIDAKEKALRGWAKATGFTQEMKGAAIGFRNKTQVRR